MCCDSVAPRPCLTYNALQELAKLCHEVDGMFTSLLDEAKATELRKTIVFDRVDGHFSLLVMMFVYCDLEVPCDKLSVICNEMVGLSPRRNVDLTIDHGHNSILLSRIFRRRADINFAQRKKLVKMAVQLAESALNKFEANTKWDFLAKNNLARACIMSTEPAELMKAQRFYSKLSNWNEGPFKANWYRFYKTVLNGFRTAEGDNVASLRRQWLKKAKATCPEISENEWNFIAGVEADHMHTHTRCKAQRNVRPEAAYWIRLLGEQLLHIL